MGADDGGPDDGGASGSRRLMLLLAAAMFVLVVDTSLMNVSISAVIDDLDTTASGVQSAIALEALVSAAFILINVVVLSQIGLVRDVPYTGDRHVDVVGAILSVVGMGGVVLGILVWQEGGEYVGLLMGAGAVALVLLSRWLVRRKRTGRVPL